MLNIVHRKLTFSIIQYKVQDAEPLRAKESITQPCFYETADDKKKGDGPDNCILEVNSLMELFDKFFHRDALESKFR